MNNEFAVMWDEAVVALFTAQLQGGTHEKS
jgi:hypothetical protein